MAPFHFSLDTNCIDHHMLHSKRSSDKIIDKLPVTVIGDDVETSVVAREIANFRSSKGERSPFFVMNMGNVKSLLENWYDKMPQVQPFHQLKCNCDPALLRLLTSEKFVGLSCCSRQELDLALQYVAEDRIIYANNLWTRTSIRYAQEKGISRMMISSLDDLDRFAKYSSDVHLILRVVMDSTLFGGLFNDAIVNVENAVNVLRRAADLQVNIVGISVQLRNFAPSTAIYAFAIAQCRRLFDIGQEIGHPMNVLDVGSVFPGSTNTSGPSFAQISQAISKAISSFFPPNTTHEDMKLIAEPGRYFTASLYSLVTNVVDRRLVDAKVLTKDDKDDNLTGYVYQINEGFYGSFACQLDTEFQLQCHPLHETIAKDETYAAIVGPTLRQEDVVLALTRMPEMQVGDWIIWNDMGAYTLQNLSSLEKNALSAPIIYHFIGRKSRGHILQSIVSANFVLVDDLECQSNESDVDHYQASNEFTNASDNFLAKDDGENDGKIGTFVSKDLNESRTKSNLEKVVFWQTVTEG